MNFHAQAKTMEKNSQLHNSFLTGMLVGMAIITIIWIAGQYMDPRREAGEERMKHLFDVVIGNDKALKQLLVEVKKNEMKNEERIKHLFDVVIGNDKALKQVFAEVKKNEQELKILRILEEETARNLNELLDGLPQMDKYMMCHKWGIRYRKLCKPSSKIYTGTGF
jgi:hypothetical protein